jgi:hypothetical protein
VSAPTASVPAVGNRAWERQHAWYVARALRGTGPHSRRARLRPLGAALAGGALVLGLAACGGEERQDADVPQGRYPVEITTAQFPTRQRLAGSTSLRLGVRNAGKKTIPNVSFTIFIDRNAIRPFSIYDDQPGLEAPDRPVWILENNYPRVAGSSAPAGAQTDNTKTFAFGPLDPGKSVEAIWRVTPVRAGDYTLHYRVDAHPVNGLLARAVTTDGAPPEGQFAVRISSRPPRTRVNDAGEVIVVTGGGDESRGASGAEQDQAGTG